MIVAAVRAAWLKDAAGNAKEHKRRQARDFLLAQNHEGETLNSHCFRHTCATWLAGASVHPKVIQTIMRHAAITLTVDTYSSLVPGQEAQAIALLPATMPGAAEAQALKATGTDDARPTPRAKYAPGEGPVVGSDPAPEVAKQHDGVRRGTRGRLQPDRDRGSRNPRNHREKRPI